MTLFQENKMMKYWILFYISILVSSASCGLLGYGKGEGSCAAAPFRSYEVKWAYGCPPFAPCCSEFGYCRPLVCHFAIVNFYNYQYFQAYVIL